MEQKRGNIYGVKKMIKKSQIKQTNNNNTVKYIQNNTVKLVTSH